MFSGDQLGRRSKSEPELLTGCQFKSNPKKNPQKAYRHDASSQFLRMKQEYLN
jgi:hypothetical protein